MLDHRGWEEPIVHAIVEDDAADLTAAVRRILDGVLERHTNAHERPQGARGEPWNRAFASSSRDRHIALVDTDGEAPEAVRPQIGEVVVERCTSCLLHSACAGGAAPER